MNNDKVLLSIGHGYSARALSRMLNRDHGWKIIGTTRTGDGCGGVAESGATCRVWPGNSLAGDIAGATHILVSVPPDASGDPVIRQLGDRLAEFAKDLTWVGYLSTTAVYGDKRGEWVDESAELAPATRRGRQRVEAERAWRNLARRSGLPLHIFRLAGIYGPGRGPLAQIQNGRKRSQVVKPGQVFNRVHVEDIARMLFASMASPSPGSVYNVCDDCPAPPEEVADFACGLLERAPLPRTQIDSADLSPMAESFYAESKRVSNSSAKNRLGLRLLYPDYKAGLRSLL